MYPFKRFLVCLDLSSSDDAVINYSAWFAKVVRAEYIYFVHIAKRLHIPNHLKEKFPNIDNPVDDSIKADIQAKLKGKFDDSINLHVTVREGNFTDNTLRLAEIKKTDLIILGKKTTDSYRGLNARRIANTCRSSVLLVPDTAVPKLESVLLPINFSKLSVMAMELALSLRKELGTKIYLQNIYKVPNGYRYTGKTYEQFAEIMKENTFEEYDKFMKVNRFLKKDVEFNASLGELGSSAECIFEEVKKRDVDLLIGGSRGRTSVASFILGSTAVGLIRYDLNIPYLVIKRKSGELDLFSAIQEI